MDLTSASETEQLIDRVLKAKEPLTLDVVEQKAEPMVKAEPEETRINNMFSRFSKGDIYFDEPTREERKAFSKAYLEENAEQPVATVEQKQAHIAAMFKDAREGNY